METTVDFEFEAPAGRLCVHRDGAVESDEINDHQVLGIDVAGHGLIVIDPCGHRGIVSATEDLRKLTGADQVYGAIRDPGRAGQPGRSYLRRSQKLPGVRAVRPAAARPGGRG